MRRAAALACLLILALAPAGLRATLAATGLGAVPTVVVPGQSITLQLTVQNNGSTMANGVTPSLTYTASGFGPVLNSGPSPASASIPGGGFTASFTWVFTASTCGSVGFSAWAQGTDGSGPVSSNGVASPPVVAQCTPSPTPVVTATPTLMVVTPSPAPLLGSAFIPGNIFHPASGGLLQLQFMEPYEGQVQIDLYDRLGRRVKHFELGVAPGSHTQPWDGRSDDGLLVSSGIYAAYFHGKGLSSVVKFAVIK